MAWGQLIYDILVQAPFLAVLIIYIVMQKRTVDRALDDLRDTSKKLNELEVSYRKLEDLLVRLVEK